MRLVFEKNKILNSIANVSKAIPSKTTSPILECILFDASTNEIRITATDTELGIEAVVEGSIEEKGKVAIDAKLIYEIIRKVEDSSITIESSNDFKVVISCGKDVFNIQGRDGEEFSYLPIIEKDNYICLKQFTLKEVIRQTLFSTAANEANKMMSGEFIEVVDSNVKFVTLDGHRISIRNITMNDKYNNYKAIVPAKTLSEISKIIPGDADNDVIIYFSKNHIMFEFDKYQVVSRLIEGEYFRIDHMITKDYITKIRVNKNNIINSIDRAMILIRENDHKPIILDIIDGMIKLKVKSSYGTMDAEVECNKEGGDLMIAFNPRFLIDALRVIDDEEVDMYFTNAKSPCFIRDENDSYVYLILPVNFINN